MRIGDRKGVGAIRSHPVNFFLAWRGKGVLDGWGLGKVMLYEKWREVEEESGWGRRERECRIK